MLISNLFISLDFVLCTAGSYHKPVEGRAPQTQPSLPPSLPSLSNGLPRITLASYTRLRFHTPDVSPLHLTCKRLLVLPSSAILLHIRLSIYHSTTLNLPFYDYQSTILRLSIYHSTTLNLFYYQGGPKSSRDVGGRSTPGRGDAPEQTWTRERAAGADRKSES